MASSEADGKFYAHPTLFPKNPENYTSDPEDWVELDPMEAFNEAKKRGELFEFDNEQDSRNFAEGAWKPEHEFNKKIDSIARQAKNKTAEQSLQTIESPGGSHARQSIGIRETAKKQFVEKSIPHFRDLMSKDELGPKEYELIQKAEELDVWPEKDVPVGEAFNAPWMKGTMKVKEGQEIVAWADKKYNEQLRDRMDQVDYAELTKKTKEGISVADPEKVMEAAGRMSEEVGGGRYTKELLYEKMLVRADDSSIQEALSKSLETNERYQNFISKIKDEALEKTSEKSFMEGDPELIQVEADYHSKVRRIGERFHGKTASAYNAYTDGLQFGASEIQERVDAGEIDKEEADKQLEELNQSLFGDYQQIEERLNMEAQNLAEIEEKLANQKFNSILNQKFNQYIESRKLSEEETEELRSILMDAEESIRGSIDKTLMAVDRMSPSATFIRRYAGSLGRSIAATSTYMGWEQGRVSGDELARVFKTAENPMEDWADLLDMDKMVKSSADLAGSMTTSMAAGIVTGVATGGLGTLPAMAATGLASWWSETTDMAGQMYRDKLQTTGSISEARNASREIVKGQVEDMWMYSLSGAPYVSKFLGKIKNVPGRIATGGGIELGEETIQEWQQTAREESVMKYGTRKRYGEFKTGESLKQTFLYVAPSFLFGAGAQSSHVVGDLIKGQQRKDFADAAIRELNLSEEINDGAEQYVQGIAFSRGALYAEAVIDAMVSQGQITETQSESLRELVKNSDSQATAAKAKGYKGTEALMWLKLDREAKNANETERAAAEEKLKQFEAAPELFPYVTVRTGMNKIFVMSEQEAQSYLSKPENARDVRDGYIAVMEKNTDFKKVMAEAAPKAKTRIARKQAKRATQNTAEAAVIDVSNKKAFSEAKATLKEAAKKVGNESAPKAVSAIETLATALDGTDTKVQVHTKESSYLEAIGDRASSEEAIGTPGVFLDDNNTIHLNLQEIGTNTAFHEGSHALIKELAVQNDGVVSDMKTFLESALPAEAAEDLRKFVGDNYDSAVADEEFVAEAIARILDTENPAFKNYEIDGGLKAIFDKIIEAVKKFLGVDDSVNLSGDMDAEAMVRGMMDSLRGRDTKITPKKSKPKKKKVESGVTGSVDAVNTVPKILFQIAGEKGFRRLDKLKKDSQSLRDLKVANSMEKMGRLPSEIIAVTGWVRDASNNWMREMDTYITPSDIQNFIENSPESKSFLNGIPVSLSDIYGKDSELMQMYPTLANYRVQLVPDRNLGGSMASMNIATQEITLSTGTVTETKSRVPRTNTARALVNSTLMGESLVHEVQHAIQHIEGFALGSNASIADAIFAEAEKMYTKLSSNSDFNLLLDAVDTVFKDKNLTRAEKNDRVAGLLAGVPYAFKNGIAHLVSRASLNDAFLKNPNLTSKDITSFIYNMASGEVMARIAEKRFLAGEDLRKVTDIFTEESSENSRAVQNIANNIVTQIKDVEYAYKKGINYPKLPKNQVRNIYKNYIPPKTLREKTRAFLAKFQQVDSSNLAEAELYVDDLMSIHLNDGSPISSTDLKDLSHFYNAAMQQGYPLDREKSAVIAGVLAQNKLGTASPGAISQYQNAADHGRYDGAHSVYAPKFQATLFHGSPYLFDRFDLNQIGTGEGVQAFGWGLYFTDKQSIAKGYADKTSLRSMRDRFLDVLPEDADFDEVTGMIGTGVFDKGQEEVLTALQESDWLGFDYPAQAISAAYGKGLSNYDPTKSLIDAIGKSKAIYKVIVNKGKVPVTSDRYRVFGKSIIPRAKNLSRAEYREGIASGEIKPLMEFETSDQAREWLEEQDKKADYMWLSWDKKPSKDQIAKVMSAAAEQGVEMTEKQYATGEQLYNDLVSTLGTAKEASMFLLKAGMDGVRYPVNATIGTTTDAAEAFNYVIFDDKSIEIENTIRFQKPLPAELEIEDGFYSNLERSVLEFKGDRASAKKWMDMLGKKDEAVFTGVRDWLAAKAPNEQVGKEYIMNWLENNRIQVEVKVLESNTAPKASPRSLPENYRYEFDASKNQHNFYDESGQLAGFGDTKEEAQSMAEARLNLMESRQAEESKQQAYDDDVYNAFNEELSRRDLVGKGQALLDAWYYDDYGSDSRLHKWAELLRFLEDQNIDIDYVLEEIDEANDAQNEVKDDETVFNRSELKLPGESENYREILITAPNRDSFNRNYMILENQEGNYTLLDRHGSIVKESNIKNKQVAEDRFRAEFGSPDDQFIKNTHFAEPNILAHLRVNNRTDSNGKSILFLEEIQSDWAQDGRKKGFREKLTKAEQERIDYLDKAFLSNNEMQEVDGYVIKYMTPADEKRLRDELEDLRAKKNGFSSVPAAPYVQNTSAWVKLALKMALKDAVAQGVDYVAWTTGEQQVARYDLSKQVEYIQKDTQVFRDGTKATLVDVSTTAGMLNFKINPETAEILSQSGSVSYGDFVGKNLEDVIGKEITKNILDAGEAKRFEDADLKVGGKGMKDFYGTPTDGSAGIVGKVAESLTGQKVGTVEIQVEDGDTSIGRYINPTVTDAGYGMVRDSRNNNEEVYSPNNNKTDVEIWLEDKMSNTENRGDLFSLQHSIEITPEIRMSVEAGQAKFQKTSPEQPLSNSLEDVAQHLAEGMASGMTMTEVTEALSRDLQIDEAVVPKISARAEYLFENNLGKQSPFRSQFVRSFLWFRHGLQDDKIFLKKMQQSIEKEVGNILPPSLNPYQRMELERSRINAAAEDMMFLVYGNKAGRYVGRRNESRTFKGRVERIKTKDGKKLGLDDFFSFMYLQHVPERNERAKSLRENNPDYSGPDTVQAAGIATDEANKAMQDMKDSLSPKDLAKMEVMAKEFREVVINERVKALADAGVLTQESAANLISGTHSSGVNWNFYLPIKPRKQLMSKASRVTDPKKGKGSSGVMKFSGLSNHKMYEMSESGNQAVADYLSSLVMIEQNRTNTALRELVQAYPNPDVWTIEKTKQVPIIDEDGNFKGVQDFTDPVSKKYGLPVYVNGKTEYIMFRDKDLFKSMERVDLSGVQKVIMATVGKITGLMRALITQLNLGFAGPNFFRDAQEGLANSTNDAVRLNIKGIKRAYLKNLIPAGAALSQDMFAGVPGTGKMSRLWAEAEAHGMKMSWANYASMDSVLDNLRKATHKHRSISDSLPVAPFKATLEAISTFNDVIENVNRLAFYAAVREALVKQGMPAEAAAQEAAAVGKNITLNFEKKGSWGSLINALYLFFNAGIQGAAKTLQLVKTNRGRSVLASMVAMGYLNRMIQAAMFSLVSPDGDDPSEKLTNSDKRLNWVFVDPRYVMSGGDAQYRNPITIPKPYSLTTPFLNIGESLYELQHGKSTMFDMNVKLIEDIGTVLDPVTGGSAFAPLPTLSEENLGMLAQGLSPDAIIRPLVQIGVNKTWNGAKIYPDYNRDEMPKNRYYQSVHPFYIDMSQRMFDSPLRINVSPEVLEFLGQEYNTGIIRETVNTLEQLQNKVRGDEVDQNRLIVVRRFAPDLDADSQTWRNRQIVESYVERSKFAKEMGEGQIESFRNALSDMVMKEEIDKRRLKEVVTIIAGRHDVKISEMLTDEVIKKTGLDVEKLDAGHDQLVKARREKERIFGEKGSAHVVLEIMKYDAKSKKDLTTAQVKRLRTALTESVLSFDIESESLGSVFDHFDYLEASDLLDGSEFGFNFEGLSKKEALQKMRTWYEKNY